MARVLRPVTGCIIRHYSDSDEEFSRIKAQLALDGYNPETFKLTKPQRQAHGGKRYLLKHERSGNLDVAGWGRSYFSDLEEYESIGILISTDLTVSFELIRGV